MNILPLGSIVQLKEGEKKLMIISRVPLYNNKGTIGYFDYAGCLHPIGQNGNQTFFFNKEDIEEVFFEGYVDEEEEKYQNIYEKEMVQVTYPKLTVQEIGPFGY
ncbi:MAG: DUF4176 domain-containing protein [Lachnospiraceae bacterium]